jgi:hypothetical protein
MRNLSSVGLLGESSVHDENLGLLQVLLHPPGRPIFPYDLLELLEIDPRPFRGKQKRRISELVKFCHENSEEDLGQIMARLKSSNPLKYESVLSTLIMLCNSLVGTKQILYYATSSSPEH